MSPMYTVKQGDYLAKIAKKHGLSGWEKIYDHEQNKEFKAKRPNPNIIYPGDKIFIPDKDPREENCRTEVKHTFRLKTEKVKINLEMTDPAGEPLSMAKYELKTKGKKQNTYTKTIDDDRNSLQAGIVKEEISLDEEDGVLKIWINDEDEDHDYEYQLKFGHLDPIDEVAGVQARLNNLGFECGKADNNKGPKTEAAIKEFQEEYGLKVDGIAGNKTQNRIKERYGC